MVIVVRVLISALLVKLNECEIHISIQPNRTYAEDAKNVTIQCSLDLSQTNTDQIYSIMLRRGNTTMVVMLKDKVEMPDRQYIVNGPLSSQNSRSAYLQVTLNNVTCQDRGNYSCRMAVRRLHRNLVLGPVSSLLTVVGKPSPVSISVRPRKSDYAVGETVVFVCSALTEAKINWTWKLSSAVTDITEYCYYNESICLYSCAGSVSHYITKEDKIFVNNCGYRGKFKGITLNVTILSSKDPDEKSFTGSRDSSSDPDEKSFTGSRDSSSGTHEPIMMTQAYTTEEKLKLMNSSPRTTDVGRKELRSIVIYTLVSATCLIFLCICACFFVSVRCRDTLSRLQQQRKVQRHTFPINRRESNTGLQGSQVAIELRCYPTESGYLTPMKENGYQSLEDDLQNRHVDAENDIENVYEEVE